MAYEPQFTISPTLLSIVEGISALRERIEGNPLTLEQVRALEEERELVVSDQRSEREVLNYFAGLRFIEKKATLKKIKHEHLFQLHRLLADQVMDQGTAGAYRPINVQVGKHFPPASDDVSPLMFELLEW